MNMSSGDVYHEAVSGDLGAVVAHPLARVRGYLLPDMEIGRAGMWGLVVKAYAARFHVLPHVLRVVSVSVEQAAFVELRTDAEGYGELSVLGFVKTSEVYATAQSLAGRHGVVVVDAPLESTVGRCSGVFKTVNDAVLYDALLGSGVLCTLPSLASYRQALASELVSSSPLRRRSALSRLRDEMAGLVALCVWPTSDAE